MDKSEAKANRMAGRYRRNARNKGSPAKRSEEGTNRLLGRRLKELRLARGVTLTQLGEAIGVSQQGCQKYEEGITALSAARLKRIAELLGVPMGYFLDVRKAKVQAEAIPGRILQLAQRLHWIERERPEAFARLRRLINAVVKNQ